MCGFVGLINYQKEMTKEMIHLEKMNQTLNKRGPDEEGYYARKSIGMGHKRLIVIDPEGGKQPMIAKTSYGEFAICYNGQLYNTKQLKQTLAENGYEFETRSDTEVLLKSYLHYGKDVVHHLNGIFAFAIWNNQKEELFLARDHFGVKPFFYTQVQNTFVFSSEIKGLLAYPGVQKTVDKQGISELFGIGPSHTAGTTVFKHIQELKPAHFAIYNHSGLHCERYWKLESKPHLDNLDKTRDTLHSFLKNSITNQLVSDVPVCTFLSGGLDSSLITKIAADHYEVNNLPPLDTYSVDYVDNDKNFVKSDFQPNLDGYYIDLMSKKIHTNHHHIILDTPELANALKAAMVARDMPGMADIDSSLLLFCQEVKKEKTVTLTGECADEIFGGYPWFFREDALSSNTFPWSIALTERQQLLHPDIGSKIDLKEYIDYRYQESLQEVQILESDSEETAEKRKISHLTLNWFMQTLLDRSDRMAMANGFEIRVPFCDHELAQYVWNIPWEMKALNGREKGLLRYVARDFLPSEIVDRKKSPYPKTHNPTYLKQVKGMLTEILEDSQAPIHNLLNTQYIQTILDTNGAAFTRPWFGQLMTGPQLLAYLCQVNMWLEKYKPEIIL